MYHALRSTTLLLGGLILGTQLAVAAAAQDVRIEHVTVISPERSAPLIDASVLIHDGRIVSLAAHDKTPALTLNGKEIGRAHV